MVSEGLKISLFCRFEVGLILTILLLLFAQILAITSLTITGAAAVNYLIQTAGSTIGKYLENQLY